MIYTTMPAAQRARSALPKKLDVLIVIQPASGGFVLGVVR